MNDKTPDQDHFYSTDLDGWLDDDLVRDPMMQWAVEQALNRYVYEYEFEIIDAHYRGSVNAEITDWCLDNLKGQWTANYGTFWITEHTDAVLLRLAYSEVLVRVIRANEEEW